MRPDYRAACLTATCLAALASADWTQFRGERGDGVALDCRPPLSWSPTENVRWRADVPGRGWSSPIVVDGEAWLTTSTKDGRALAGLAFDLETGERTFERVLFEVAEPREIHTFNSYASPTPAADEDRVYLSWGSYGLAAVDHASREITWVRRDLPCRHWRGPGSSPVPVTTDKGPRLLMTYDGYDQQYAACLDAATGETVWRTNRPADFGSDDGDQRKGYATPLLLGADDGFEQPLVVSPTSFGVFAYGLTDGREVWRAKTERHSPACRPVLGTVGGEPRLFVAAGFGRGSVVAIDPRDGRVAWSQRKTMPSKPSPTLVGGRLYCVSDNGVLSVLDAATGQPTAQLRLGGNFSASPLLVSGPDGPALVAPDESGRTAIVSTGETPEVLAENSLPSGVLACPVPAGDGLLLRTRDALYLIAED